MTTTNDPLVTICCITYNHENYIRDAIEGFLMQKTDFPFEIIIHDDASTDGTADIIREYEQKYSAIIKPIYQTENQHSKGNRPSLLTYRAAKGKYIAICEGDDYWTDPLKLQKQIQKMEKHPDCYISFHPAVQRWVDGNNADKIVGYHSNNITIFSTEAVILGGGGFMHTGSIILNSLAIPRITSFFDIAREAPIEDYYTQVIGAEHGGALYIPDVMSLYRSGDSNSWSGRIKKNSSMRYLWYASWIKCNFKLSEFLYKNYSQLLKKRRCNVMSNIITDIELSIEQKESIINKYSDDINHRGLLLWYLVFKNHSIVKILHSMYHITHQIQNVIMKERNLYKKKRSSKQ